MGDQERKQEPTSISPQPDAEKENKKKESTALSDEELKKVSGGLTIGMTDVIITSTQGPKPE
jgi:bacteriocin-like protein